MGWSKDHGNIAKVNADYAKVQGDVAKQEATNLSQLKTDVEVATQNASTAADNAITATSSADNAASEAIAQANHAKNEGDRAKAEADRLTGTDVSVLDNKVTNLSDSVNAKFGEVTTQLAQKATKGQIAVSDIDKNKGKFDQTYMSDELLQQMAGTTPINAVPADDSVTLRKTTIGKPKKNLFNAEKKVGGFILDLTNGEAVASVSYANVTEYIEVKPLEYYTFNKSFPNMAIYDSNKVFIKSVKSQTSTVPIIEKMPTNAKFVRATVYNGDLPTAQIEKGWGESTYEPYSLIVAKDYIETPTLGNKDLPKINVEDTSLGKNVSKNLFNKNTVMENAGLSDLGLPVFNSTATISEFIKVTPSSSYAFTNVGKLVWYDSSYNFISFKNGGFIEVSPTDAIYLRIMFTKANASSVQVEKGTARTAYEPYREVIDRKYLDLPETTPSVNNSGVNNEIDLALASENAMKFIPNVKEPLNIPTYDGSGAATHPSVLYFPEGWNGYKFWMAMTPYPNSDNKFENPSIVASNDNITWYEPAPNPIAPLRPENNYQSDPCIFMNGNRMELWYRVSTLVSQFTWGPTEFYRMTTTDGVNWTTRELMFTGATFEDEILSPTIRMADSKYCMWYVLSDGNKKTTVKYAESNDGKTWVARTLDITLPSDSGYTFWHGDTIRHADGSVEMAIMCKHPTERWATFYTKSSDNTKFTKPTLIIKSTYPSHKRWDSGQLYRPAIVLVGDEYYVYYSTPQKIGLTKGKSMLSLGLGKEKFKGYPTLFNVNVMFGAQNAFLATENFDKYPPESIVYFMVWSAVDAGWPELSGFVETKNLFNEVNRAVQFFYPTDKATYYYKRSAKTTGWSAWVKYTGTAV